MKIADLKSGQGKVDVTVTIRDIDEPRAFEKFGKQIRVANATVVDDSGEMKMTLWNDEIDKVKTGMTIKITNGYVNEFKGEKQLTVGKFGKMQVMDGKEESNDSSIEEESENFEDY
jgi:replication factor A1